MHTISIPRGVTLVAGGQFDMSGFDGESAVLRVASEESSNWGVAQSPFMRDNAKTTGFKMNLKVDSQNISYSETTFLDIYGKTFDHSDTSKLIRLE